MEQKLLNCCSLISVFQPQAIAKLKTLSTTEGKQPEQSGHPEVKNGPKLLTKMSEQ